MSAMSDPNLAGQGSAKPAQIVDGLYGYTMEFAANPAAHEQQYDWLEGLLAAAYFGSEAQP